MREAAEAEKDKFVTAITKSVKPKMSALLKSFSSKGHALKINREDLSSSTPAIQYALTMDEPGRPTYLIEFDSNISEVEVAFRMSKHSLPKKSYDKNLDFDLTQDDVEQEVINGLKFLKTQ